MARIFYDGDADIGLVQSRRIGIVGYGSQGWAHAQNLRDKGATVRVGLRAASASRSRAETDGFEVQSLREVSEWADVIALLLPDQYHHAVYEGDIRPALSQGKVLIVAHGFSICYREVIAAPEIDVVLVAPVGPGAMVRQLFVEGHGVPAVFAVEQDASGRAEELALAYAKGLGCTRAGVIRSTIEEETQTDLFGEQAVLCGGIPHLMKAGYDALVAAGYQPELAYFECVHQVKLIVDLLYRAGFDYLYDHISDTAEFGAYLAGPTVVNAATRDGMAATLNAIRDGSFAREWIADFNAGMPTLSELRTRRGFAEIDEVGGRLRSTMPR